MKKTPTIIRVQPKSLHILAFSDCRVQNIPEFINWISSQSPFDLVVYAGDDIKRFRPLPQINYFEQLASLTKYGLAAIIGNDDGSSVRKLIIGKNVYELHSRPLLIGNFLFVGNEGSPPGIGYNIYTERQIKNHLKSRIPSRTKKTVVIISHAPPFDCLDTSFRYGDIHHVGSKALRTFIDNHPSVSLVVCGHSHFSGGRSTKLSNATVLNVASHDNENEPLKFACIDLLSNGIVKAEMFKFPDLEMNVSGIGRVFQKRLALAGIKNTKQLSESDPVIVGTAIGKSPESCAILIHRAKSTVHKKPYIITPFHLPESNRLYLDIETNRNQSFCWLIGIGSDKDNNVVQFRAQPESTEEERKILLSMIEYFNSFKGCSILHYSASDFDKRVLIKRLNYHQLVVPGILGSSLDVHMKLYNYIALPIRNFGLAEVARYLGYSFQFLHMDGQILLSKYEQALKVGQPIPDELYQKNIDDVLALRHLVQNIPKLNNPPAG